MSATPCSGRSTARGRGRLTGGVGVSAEWGRDLTCGARVSAAE
jgi:hypothetical protein